VLIAHALFEILSGEPLALRIAQTLKPGKYYLTLEVINTTTIILYLMLAVIVRSSSPLSIEDTFQIAAQARNAILLADTIVTHNNNVFLGEFTGSNINLLGININSFNVHSKELFSRDLKLGCL